MLRISLLLVVSLVTTHSTVFADLWSYEGDTGPEYWGSLSPDYALCSSGVKQSPIDLVNAMDENLPDLEFSYKRTPLVITNNGHTVQVNYTPGSFLRIGQKKFDVLQFHFHTPSEHKKDGSHTAMEAHIVHMDSGGQLAVVGVMLVIGKENAFIKDVFDNMPVAEGEVTVDKRINVNRLIPDDHYLTYSGSLTTPPCSENVHWIVMADPVEISQQQLEQFNAIFHHNNRPVQLLNDRIILKDD